MEHILVRPIVKLSSVLRAVFCSIVTSPATSASHQHRRCTWMPASLLRPANAPFAPGSAKEKTLAAAGLGGDAPRPQR